MSEKKNDLLKELGIQDIVSNVSDEWQSQPFLSGFSMKVVIAAFFIAFFMLPGIMFMGLAIGSGIGSGAEWVTVLLFLEVARRSYQTLRRQELFMILYMAQSLAGVMGGVMLAGGMFAGLIWNQYLKNSDIFLNFNLTDKLPQWFSPSIEVLKSHTFFHAAWLPAIIVAVAGLILYKMQFFGLGYLTFRVTSDVEKLPFPMASIGAEGATALAESEAKGKNSWRWSVFSVLAVIGLVWGLIYMGVPTISSALFGKAIQLIPIPFYDMTPITEKFLPSAAMALGFDLGLILVAFILPWRIIVGGAVTCFIAQIILPPLFYKLGIHSSWKPGFSVLDTQIVNGLDIWMSIGIGAAISLAFTGIYMAIKNTVKTKKNMGVSAYDWKALLTPPKGRGDFPFWVAIMLYVVSAIGYVVLCNGLVNAGWFGGIAKAPHDRFPVWIFVMFAFFWTPINTYINAKLAGIAGQSTSLPFIREGSIMLSGYKSPDIWIAPTPLMDFGGVSTLYKQLELTRTKFTSLLWVELTSILVLTLAGLFYWNYLWKLGPIPSDMFPYAKQMWPFIAKNAALWFSALGEGNNQMLEAIKGSTIIFSTVGFSAGFVLLSIFKIPLAFYFGAVAGIGGFSYVYITMLIGLGVKKIVSKMLGEENLKKYAPVMMAGYAAGFGIAGILVVSIVLIKTAVTGLAY